MIDDGLMDLTYSEVGATRAAAGMPPHYRHVRRRRPVGVGEAAFEAAAEALRDWRIFSAAGLTVRATAPLAEVGVGVTNGLGFGLIRLWAPCRIVWLVDEPGRRFGYGMGTLSGHPARGEEAFEVTLEPDGLVWAEVRAFSRPATWYTRLGGPVTRVVQEWMTGRYLYGLRRLLTA
jgi:uncharacterized protein (UPF0548 family)